MTIQTRSHRVTRLLRAAAIVAIAAGVSAASCDSGPTAPEVGASYRLVAVDGRSLPAAIDSFAASGRTRITRVSGRSLALLSADSAQYTMSTDVIDRDPVTGAVFPVSFECTSLRVPWRRAGKHVILDFTGIPGFLRWPVDTLRTSGTALLQTLKRGDPVVEYTLSYRRISALPPGCALE